MPWSGGSFTRTNGVHTGSTLWVQDRDAGTKILATRHDTHDQDLADGINATLEKSGSNAATGNLDIGSNRITLVADGTAKTDAATVNQLQSNAPAFQATDTGTANAYVIALSPAITAYAAGQAITFKAANASTTASTLNVNTLGTKALKKKNDQDIASGDIEASQIITAVYDGTSFQVTSQLGSEASAGGSNTQVQYNSSGSLAGSANFTFDGTNADVSGDITGSTLNADGDTSASDNAAIGYTAGEGLILTGQGSTADVTIKNDADGTVMEIPTGTTTAEFKGDLMAAAQPMFFATLSSEPSNVTGDGTTYTVLYDTETYDIGSNYNTTTGVFTAPTSGKYVVGCNWGIVSPLSGHTSGQLNVVSDGPNSPSLNINPYNNYASTNIAGYNACYVLELDAADTIKTTLNISGSSKTIDLYHGTGGSNFFASLLPS